MAGEGWKQRQGEKRLEFVERVRQAQLAENAAKAAALAAAAKPKRKRTPTKAAPVAAATLAAPKRKRTPKQAAAAKVADHVDGYDRDDVGLSSQDY